MKEERKGVIIYFNNIRINFMKIDKIIETFHLYENFNIIPVIIPKRYKSKDFAELVSNNSLKQLKSIIKKGIKYIYNYDKRQRNKDSGNLQYDETMPY